jgi:hypothetical protein
MATCKKIGVEVLAFDLDKGTAQVESATGIVVALTWAAEKEAWQVA